MFRLRDVLIRPALLLLVCTVLTVPPWAVLSLSATHSANDAASNVSITGSRKFQLINGFGVNGIPKTWQGGALRPGLDLLVAGGSTLWRIDVNNGHSDWEQTNDDGDPFNYNWTYYNVLYGGPQFSDLWSELAYLNSRGISNIELSMSGLTPTWMGGNTIPTTIEDEFVEEITSLVYYARNTAHIQFRFLSPLNEPSTCSNSPEGACVSAAQFVRIMDKMAQRLDTLGLADIKLIGPHTASCDQVYTQALLANANVMNHLGAFAYHSYGTGVDNPSCLGFSASIIAASAYPNTPMWMGEWNQCVTDGCLDGGQQVADEWAFAREMTAELINHLSSGASSAQAWDAWDNWHEHNPCCAIDHWGEIYQDSNGVYQTKPRYYTNAQIFKFIAENMRRVGSSTTNNSISILGFSDDSAETLTITGRNKSTTAQALTVSLTGVPATTTLAFYQTSASKNLNRENDVPVASGAFAVTVDGDSFFTLTTISAAGGIGSPTPTGIPSATATATSSPTETAATATRTPSAMPLPTDTYTPPPVPTITATSTATPTGTLSATPTPTSRDTPVATTTPTGASTPAATPTGTTTGCLLADVNCDGIVDIRDYGLWRQHFGETTGSAVPSRVAATGLVGDINQDGIVDIRDYGVWRQEFGQTSAAGAHATRGASEASAVSATSPTTTLTRAPTAR